MDIARRERKGEAGIRGDREEEAGKAEEAETLFVKHMNHEAN